jgi:hypothetical protein
MAPLLEGPAAGGCSISCVLNGWQGWDYKHRGASGASWCCYGCGWRIAGSVPVRQLQQQPWLTWHGIVIANMPLATPVVSPRFCIADVVRDNVGPRQQAALHAQVVQQTTSCPPPCLRWHGCNCCASNHTNEQPFIPRPQELTPWADSTYLARVALMSLLFSMNAHPPPAAHSARCSRGC